MDKPVTKTLKADDFWQFSVGLYSRPDVKEACLKAQNDKGVDVNALLLCLWLDTLGLVLSREGQEQLLNRSQRMQKHHIMPLRQYREGLERGTSDYHTALQKELEAERIAQGQLIDSISGQILPANTHAQTFNLDWYCSLYAINHISKLILLRHLPNL